MHESLRCPRKAPLSKRFAASTIVRFDLFHLQIRHQLGVLESPPQVVLSHFLMTQEFCDFNCGHFIQTLGKFYQALLRHPSLGAGVPGVHTQR